MRTRNLKTKQNKTRKSQTPKFRQIVLEHVQEIAKESKKAISLNDEVKKDSLDAK